MDTIITGASRGIGRALSLALAGPQRRLILVARDRAALNEVAALVEDAGGRALVLPADLSSLRAARALGAELARLATPNATLVHNAGVWPAARTLTDEGYETSFVVNHLAGLALQRPLLDAGALGRVLTVSAGLLVKGRFDAARTPTGADFSWFRTYATTKLCFAIACRDVARAHPALDVTVMHPGVVRTELGARRGPLGALVRFAKRGWEEPTTCAQRLVRVLARPAAPSGAARFLVEEREQPWPQATLDESTVEAVRAATRAALA